MKTIYKIFAPILTIAVLPAIFFLPFLRLSAKTLLSEGATGLLGLPEYSSLYALIKNSVNADGTTQMIMKVVQQLFTGEDGAFSKSVNGGLLIAALVFLALMVVLALLAFGFSIFSKKTAFCVGFSAGGIVCALIGNNLFNAFAKPFLDGTVSLKNLLSGADALSGLLGSLVTVEHFELALAYQVCIVLLGLAAVLGIASQIEGVYDKG